MPGHLLAASLLASGPSVPQEPLRWKDGDTVALVGNTFVEREQRDGFIELALTLAAYCALRFRVEGG